MCFKTHHEDLNLIQPKPWIRRPIANMGIPIWELYTRLMINILINDGYQFDAPSDAP